VEEHDLTLTPEAEALLVALAEHRGWYSLKLLDAHKSLPDDAIAFVPVLVRHGMLRHDFRLKAVRSTLLGQAYANALKL
jgi:hypothetical protein